MRGSCLIVVGLHHVLHPSVPRVGQVLLSRERAQLAAGNAAPEAGFGCRQLPCQQAGVGKGGPLGRGQRLYVGG